MAEQRSDDVPGETAWERRRRIAAVFGDDLPSVTSDEASADGSDRDHRGDGSASEKWLRENRPPHHQ
ncbi:hypothetical protein ACXVUM_14055 [Williamsia sp. SKLECPSW1]